MFSLIYGLWQYIFQKEELRILILGTDLPTPTPFAQPPVSVPVPTRCQEPALSQHAAHLLGNLPCTAQLLSVAMPGYAA